MPNTVGVSGDISKTTSCEAHSTPKHITKSADEIFKLMPLLRVIKKGSDHREWDVEQFEAFEVNFATELTCRLQFK